MRLRSLATATALAVAATPFLTSSALSADTVVGESFVPDNGCGGSFYALQIEDATGRASFKIPADGVITSWSWTAGGSAPNTVALRIGRPSSAPSGWDFAGGTDPITPPSDTTTNTPARVPVKTGDVLGFYFTGFAACGTRTNAGGAFLEGSSDATTGPAEAEVTDPGIIMPMTAKVEADADGDGYGDTTQDLCPTDATTQDACPVVTPPVVTPPATQPVKDTTAPDTRILILNTSRALGKKGNGKLRVTFTANENPARYRCSVDNAPLTPCGSTYGGEYGTKLKPGRHTFTVVATDAAGNTDTTPATQAFKVKKAKRK